MFCEFLIINLTLRIITCLGSQLNYSMSTAIPKAGYEIPVGRYAIKGFYVDAITTYGGKRVNVGKYVICLSNGSCIHEYPPDPNSIGKKVTHGCFRVKTILQLFKDVRHETVVFVEE